MVTQLHCPVFASLCDRPLFLLSDELWPDARGAEPCHVRYGFPCWRGRWGAGWGGAGDSGSSH